MIYELRRSRQTLKEISPAYRAIWDLINDTKESEFKCRVFSTSYELRETVRKRIEQEVRKRSIEEFLKQRDVEKSFGEKD